jgi:hypothetical protein
MSAIDIESVKKAARDQINKERTDLIKGKLIAQMRIVENAKQVLRGEELKLADLEAQVEDGTL